MIRPVFFQHVRGVLESHMTTDCVIYRAGTATKVAEGGYEDGATVTVDTTKCFIGSIGSTSAEREIAAQNTEADLYTVRLPYDCDMAKNHWMIANGLTYTAIAPLESDVNVYVKWVMGLQK